MSKRRSADCLGHLNAVALRFKPILADHWSAGYGPRRRGRPALASIGFCNYLMVFCGSWDGGVREVASRGGDAGVTPWPPPAGALFWSATRPSPQQGPSCECLTSLHQQGTGQEGPAWGTGHSATIFPSPFRLRVYENLSRRPAGASCTLPLTPAPSAPAPSPSALLLAAGPLAPYPLADPSSLTPP